MIANLEETRLFLECVDQWFANLKPAKLSEIARDPGQTAICCTDIINGFCYEGPLSSPRVAALVPPIVDLFRRAHAAGIRDFLLSQDTHTENAEEFKAFPPHCTRGTSESQTVREFTELPFASEFVFVKKNSLSPALGTDFDRWLAEHPNLQTLIVMGDCTDFCVYFLAMHLRLFHNAYDRPARVIVPANLVDTFDIPVDVSCRIDAKPHPGDFFHLLFLYHLAINGIEVVKEIA